MILMTLQEPVLNFSPTAMSLYFFIIFCLVLMSCYACSMEYFCLTVVIDIEFM